AELSPETAALGSHVHLRRIDDCRWFHKVFFFNSTNAAPPVLLPAGARIFPASLLLRHFQGISEWCFPH
ncbi:MAG: hypothetical protein J5792_06190, partial [Bacteroidales bacterium]|nr:hypothetical protein [Bacteroidales bacterium]